jgi:CheY-like chemotaxis protein
MDGTPIVLAVVEKDLDLISRLRRFADQTGIRMLVARSAEEAILYIRGIGVYQDRARYPQPSIVLLDSRNADCSDLEVLGWIRLNSGDRDLRVGILTSEESHELHVLCAIDPASFIVNRATLFDLADLAGGVPFTEAAQGAHLAAQL